VSNHRDGRIGHRKINDHVGIRFADDPHSNAYRPDAGDNARVFAQQRMIGRFQRRHDLKPRIRNGQRGDTLTHPSGGSVDGEFHEGIRIHII
jgi:hypothetical protein